MKRTSLLYYIIIATLTVSGQNITGNIPFITNYPKEIYKAGTQTWDITQDFTGRIYFANNDGMLSYDGNVWQIHTLPNKTIVRSLAIDEGGNIYVGGQDEFGRFEADSRGNLVFHSLKSVIPEAHRSFEDVWDIVLDGTRIFFRTTRCIYLIDGDRCSVYPAEATFHFLGKSGSQVLAQDQRGLLIYADGEWKSLPGSGDFGKYIVSGLSALNKSLLVHTLKNGSFVLQGGTYRRWSHETLDFFNKAWINSSSVLPNGRIALGTSQSGVVILQPDGTPLQWIRKQSGLQNNNILALFCDRTGSLWVGMNNGLDYIESSSPFSIIFPDGDLKDAGYAAGILGDEIFLGTNNGLYRAKWSTYTNPFRETMYEKVPNSSGQVWGLNKIGNQIFLGHHEGAFSIQNGNLQQLNSVPGAWKFVELPAFPGYMVSGNYDGVYLYHQVNGRWEFVKKLPGLNESSRIITPDEKGNLWVSHPYRGIYRLSFPNDPQNTEVSFFDSGKGLPLDNFNSVYLVRNQIMAATARGVYQFNYEKEVFEPNITLNEYLGENSWVKLLKEDQNGNIWFVVGNETGLLSVEEKGLETEITRIDLPELSEKLVKGHEFIYPYDDHNVFFPSERGFIHYDPRHDQPSDSLFTCFINHVRMIASRDSVVFGGFEGNLDFERKESASFDYKQNAFKFSFTSTRYDQAAEIEFRYQLKGFEKEWNTWTTVNSKEYTNLSPGNYEFLVKARDQQGNQSQTARYQFVITPAWYASNTAQIIYVLAVILILAIMLWLPRKRFQRETDELRTIMSQQKEEQHQQISQLNSVRLNEEVRHKNQELATATMHLVQKNEILTKIRSELTKIKGVSGEADRVKKIGNLIRLIEYDLQIDKDWEQFAYHFDQVHRDFLKRLSEEFPQLTPTDHRLCAYLRMNLSSKEIAPLMNISVRGVETGRYRLRKKMDLDHDVNLNEFMMQF